MRIFIIVDFPLDLFESFTVYSTSSRECEAVGIRRSITTSLGTTG